RKGDVPCPLDAGGIVLRSNDDKIVVHHGIALHAKPFRNEFLLCLPGMHENHVGIAAARGVERLAGTLGDDFNVDAGLGLEQRQDVAEQARVLRRSGGGDYDGLVPRAYGPGGDEGNGRGHDGQASAGRHDVLLLVRVTLTTTVKPAARQRERKPLLLAAREPARWLPFEPDKADERAALEGVSSASRARSPAAA